MPLFHYSALTSNGETVQGTKQADDRFALYKEIEREGKTVTSYKEVQKGAFSIASLSHLFSHVSAEDVIMFARNVSAMIIAGLSLTRALAVMERQSRKPRMKEILSHLMEKIEKGGTFHDALSDYSTVFSSLMIAMVKAGEESGNLSDSLAVVAVQMDRAHQLKKKIKGALIYPSIILIALVAIGILLLTFVVPTLQATFEQLAIELPTSTKIIIGASDFLVHHTILAFGGGLVIISLIVAFLRTAMGQMSLAWVLLRTPVIGALVKETNSARTARTLSSLLSSGVEVLTALSITREVVQNSFYQAVIQEAEERIQKGSPIAETFTEHDFLYPPLVGELMAVGEETGKLPEMLTRLAEFYENEIEQKTKDLSTIIEPFLMIIVGAVVGFFAVSMITPIYSISQGL